MVTRKLFCWNAENNEKVARNESAEVGRRQVMQGSVLATLNFIERQCEATGEL